MCRVTACALPYRSRGCDRGVAQGLPLRDAPGFGIASLQLLNLCQDQKEATLVYAIGFSKFDLMPRFPDQAGIHGNACEKKPALGMPRIDRGQPFGCLRTRQIIPLGCQSERGQIRMRCPFPSFGDASLRPPFLPIASQTRGVGQRGWPCPPINSHRRSVACPKAQRLTLRPFPTDAFRS